MSIELCNRIFVYGTLINKESFFEVTNKKPDKIDRGWINATLYNCGNFPMILEDPDRKVYGLVFSLKNLEEILPVLDNYERCNIKPKSESFYLRRIVKVNLETNERVSAWTYLGNPSSEFCKKNCTHNNLIDSGRWELAAND